MERDLDRLVPIARRLARRAGRAGITMADVRMRAMNAGILTGGERDRRLSWLNLLMPRAGLQATVLYRASHLPAQKQVPRRVWVDPQFWDGTIHGAHAAK